MYKDKKVLVGVTGGIAAYKTCELVRMLVRDGAKVSVIMTPEATNFIHPNTFKALSGRPVIIDMFDDGTNDGMAHISLTRENDLFIIAPATQNTIAKIANGLADNIITAAAAASICPIVIAPAMNHLMWNSPANLRNIETLKADGITVLEPNSGTLACNEEGVGRMKEAEEIYDLASDSFYKKHLKGKKALLTVGGTFEPIDPVRGITNISSGKMGMALARSLRHFGCDVTVIYSQIKTSIPAGINAHYVRSALDMYQKVLDTVTSQDIFVGVAAVADYRATEISANKIKKDSDKQSLDLRLVENPDILSSVASLPHPPFCVAFAAESQNLEEYARRKMQQKKVPMLVANLVSQAMGKDTTKICIFDPKMTVYPTMEKQAAAEIIANSIVRKMGLSN